jgi:hypothetical protein
MGAVASARWLGGGLPVNVDPVAAVLPFLDLDLLLLARYLQRFRQVDAQHAIVELGLDLRRVGMAPDRSACGTASIEP